MGDDKCEPTMNPAQSETPGMLGNSMRENRETPMASGSSTPDRLEKATSYTTSMHAAGESDERAVPAKRPDNRGRSPAGGGGGKPVDRGERRRDLHAPDTGPGTRVPGTRRCAGSSPQGQEAEVHRLAAPCDGRTAPGQLLLAQEESGAGSGRSDMGRV